MNLPGGEHARQVHIEPQLAQRGRVVDLFSTVRVPRCDRGQIQLIHDPTDQARQISGIVHSSQIPFSLGGS